MFNKLVASGNAGSRKTWTPGAVSVSVMLHAVLLAAGVYYSYEVVVAEEEEEEVTFMEVEEPPPPEEEVAPPPEMEVPPPPQGFQELIPPMEPPPFIPDVDLTQVAVNTADFSGIGLTRGTAAGTGNSAAADSAQAFDVGVLESIPAISNLRTVQEALQRNYPRLLLNSGIEGTVNVQFVIQPDGSVDLSSIKVVDTTHEQFAAATIRVIEEFRFSPGRYRGEPVRVLIQMPIQWTVGS